MLLENHIKTQLPSRSEYQQELPKLIYNKNNNISELISIVSKFDIRISTKPVTIRYYKNKFPAQIITL
jgi:hypothetical protein